MSGDYTLEAIKHGVESVLQEEADDYFLLAVSDANLRRYDITHDRLKTVLNQAEQVRANCVFIASLDDEADRTAQSMPGQAYVCKETTQLPQLFKRIFSQAI